MEKIKSTTNFIDNLLIVGILFCFTAAIFMLYNQKEVVDDAVATEVVSSPYDQTKWPTPGEFVTIPNESETFSPCRGNLYFTSLPAKCLGANGELVIVNPPNDKNIVIIAPIEP